MHDLPAIVEQRDPAFWVPVFEHPQVRHVFQGNPITADIVRCVLSNPQVKPFASAHGGWIFVGLDPLGRTFDVHAAYTPEGWGSEANATFKHGLGATDGDVYLVTEIAGNPQSRPPLSFGFRQASEYRPSVIGDVRTWVLTREAWLASPVYRRLH